ncbi:MAG: hypothetical protein GY705_16330, partial [Bacteroidetes bacterium]|nr:hypothetical protein [Bacteroidota bacterium]
LRPYSKRFSAFEGIRNKRIVNAIKKAAQNNEIFHLWWHPHNFGANTAKNLDFLEAILFSFSEMKKEYEMESLNMGEISALVANKNEV